MTSLQSIHFIQSSSILRDFHIIFLKNAAVPSPPPTTSQSASPSLFPTVIQSAFSSSHYSGDEMVYFLIFALFTHSYFTILIRIILKMLQSFPRSSKKFISSPKNICSIYIFLKAPIHFISISCIQHLTLTKHRTNHRFTI